MPSSLTPDRLRKTCDPQKFTFETTEEMACIEGIVGQARAVQALNFGLGMFQPGFNIYMAGPAGTGKTTFITTFLQDLAPSKETPSDWCYVNNFRDPYRPHALKLPPGVGRQLREDMRRLVEAAKKDIPRSFESDEYVSQRESTISAFQKQREESFARLGEKAQAQGFALQSSHMGFLLIPLAEEGRPMESHEYQALSAEIKEEIQRRREVVDNEVKATLKQLRTAEKETNESLEHLDREVATFSVGHLVEDLLEKYTPYPQLLDYLNSVMQDIIENVDQFRQPPPQSQAQTPFTGMAGRDRDFHRYEVNVVVDNSGLKGAPIVSELNPSYPNLFGRIEKEAQFGALVTDFTMVRGGALHRANGGYLLLQAAALLSNPFSWEGLKRAIRCGEISVEEMAEWLGFTTTKTLRPEPIPLDAKLILIGNPWLYYLLLTMDEDFNELFKVKADFDTRMDRDVENEMNYAAFACTLCTKENLKPCDRAAVAKLVEYGSRLAEDQEKLSTKFGEVADLMREAHFWAQQDGSQYVSGSHVRKAAEEKVYRANLIQERIKEMIQRGTIKIDTIGQVVGQVNGLAVMGLGTFAFGRPSRITVALGLGREGLMDIERESRLAGRIHTKGVMILGGYLTEKYAQDKPLTLSARLVFEQSYEEIEGDSASSTELYALLSRLSSLPIKQGIAVTGSVNQKGEVQAIGGVNEKIEGFYEVCKAIGFTGEQGVVIPESNVAHLMLKEEVVEAVEAGRFHVYPVTTIDQGIEVLTGVSAGERQQDGTYPTDTVHARVDARLREIAEGLRKFGRDEGDREKKKETPEDKEDTPKST
ncbi:MAG: AAA family ATPase [Chloroflexi bacterium]|nr:AAA family ATPase [Chloroflexota bacterium]